MRCQLMLGLTQNGKCMLPKNKEEADCFACPLLKLGLLQIKLSIDPKKARHYYEEGKSGEKDVCPMCGEFCAIKRVKDFFQNS